MFCGERTLTERQGAVCHFGYQILRINTIKFTWQRGRLNVLKMEDYPETYISDTVSIGYVPGTAQILFVKTGQGSTIYGDENKHLELAFYANEKYGCSVFVSATLGESREVYDDEMRMVKRIVADPNPPIYYLGISKGGLLGCWYGADNPQIKRLVSVNAPLMINFHNRTLPAIKAFSKERLTLLYGSLDPSFRYVPFVDRYANVVTVEGGDHNLKGASISMREIVDKYLLFDIK